MHGLYELRKLMERPQKETGVVIAVDQDLLRVSTSSGVRTVRNPTTQKVPTSSEVLIEGNQFIGVVSKKSALKVYFI